MDPIIDVHGHLGDILYPAGGALIARRGVPKPAGYDPTSISERRLHRDPLRLGRLLYTLLAGQITRAERARNATATLENLSASLDESGISHAVCLPIPPHVRFADLAAARQADPRIVPFTGVDFTRRNREGRFDPSAELAADVKAGARGLKLHPIIQHERLTSEATHVAVESYASHRLPVLFHCGISSYYLAAERSKEAPRHGAICDAAALVADFPHVRFIAGHAGLFQVGDVIRRLARHANVWVDTSFQPVRRVRQLIEAFGPDRVLFGSDWPYGNRLPALAIVREVCRGDSVLERRLLFDNAAEVIGGRW